MRYYTLSHQRKGTYSLLNARKIGMASAKRSPNHSETVSYVECAGHGSFDCHNHIAGHIWYDGQRFEWIANGQEYWINKDGSIRKK